MATVVRSIDIDLPVRVVYDQWTQFEMFPEFMEGVEEVSQLDDATLKWRANVAGQTREWTARISEQSPDSYIAWQGFGDVDSTGAIYFEAIGENQTRVTAAITFSTETTGEKVADFFGLVEARTAGDLQRFRDFIEGRHSPSGSWRGVIRSGEVRSA